MREGIDFFVVTEDEEAVVALDSFVAGGDNEGTGEAGVFCLAVDSEDVNIVTLTDCTGERFIYQCFGASIRHAELAISNSSIDCASKARKTHVRLIADDIGADCFNTLPISEAALATTSDTSLTVYGSHDTTDITADCQQRCRIVKPASVRARALVASPCTALVHTRRWSDQLTLEVYKRMSALFARAAAKDCPVLLHR